MDKMNKEQLMNVIENNYAVIMSVNGNRNVQTTHAQRFFNINQEYKEGTTLRVPNHSYPCRLKDIFISDSTKTIFLALKEVSE